MALAISLAAPCAAAEDPSGVASGDGVRVTLPARDSEPKSPAYSGEFLIPFEPARARVTVAGDSGQSVVGRLRALTDSRLVLIGKFGGSSIPLDSIGRLEIERPGAGSTASGALTGLAIGGALGTALGSTADDNNSGQYLTPSRAGTMGILAVALGAVGAAIGSGADRARHTGRWEPIEPSALRTDNAGRLWGPIGATQPIRVMPNLEGPSWYTGTVVAFEPDTLVLQRRQGLIKIPMRYVERIETTWTRKDRRLYGGILGAGIGLLIGATTINGGSENSDAAGAVLAGVAGGLVGWVAAKSVTVPRWERIPLPPRELAAE